MSIISLVLAGCGTGPATPAAQARPSTTSPPPPDLVTACTNQIVYWAGEQLRAAPDKGFDYQHMGLTGDENDVLRQVVTRAEVEGAGVVERLAREGCAELATQPSVAPWGTGGTT